MFYATICVFSWAADGQDGNGLHPKNKIGAKSSSLGKLAETLIMIYFLFENLLDIFPLAFCVRQRYLVLIWGSLTQKILLITMT